MNRGWVWPVAIAALVSGCATPGWMASLFGTRERPVTTVEVAPSVLVNSVLAYRLVTSPKQADSPSRLLILHVYLDTLGKDVFRIDPQNVQVRLPNGTVARAFDRDRAEALLRRLHLALGDLSYVRTGNGRQQPAGGINPEVREELKRRIAQGLLQEGLFTHTEPRLGYLLVDTQQPVASLDGAILEVRAQRITDSSPVRGTHRFATTTVVRQ